jgi:polyhydroxybutyrate depolymerase
VVLPAIRGGMQVALRDGMQRTIAFITILALAALATFSVPAAAGARAPGDYKENITVGSLQRSYILHVPRGYDGSKALPLVFVLHGGGGSAQSMVGSTGFDTKADSEGFFVAYLQGTVGDRSGWNSGIVDAGVAGADDVGFVRDLTKKLEKELKVDRKRVYAAGFSNGGFMTHRLAADLPELLASVAVVEGAIAVSSDGGKTFGTLGRSHGPIPIMMVHGKSDDAIKYYGGQGGHAFVKPVADAVAYWTRANGCKGKPASKTSAEGNVTDAYLDCQDGSAVILVSTAQGEHQWPTSDNAAKLAGTDTIWAFFKAHPAK